MLEGIVIGLMLNSKHLDEADIQAEASANVKAESNYDRVCPAVDYHECKPRTYIPDSGQPFSYENGNTGIYAIYKGWTAGVYRNSYRRTSVFGGYTFQGETQYGEFSATLGAASGYKRQEYSWVRDEIRYHYTTGWSTNVVPLVMLSYATPPIPGTQVKPRLMYTPKKKVLTIGVESQF